MITDPGAQSISAGEASPEKTAKGKGSASDRVAFKRMSTLILATVFCKIAVMVLFSSDYENQLFVPFVRHYLENFGNPWQDFFLGNSQGDEFPYQPLMLYILSFFCAPLTVLGWDNCYLRNFFFKLPTLISDCAIAYLLFQMFPGKWRNIFWFYFFSPIILYACYMHSQLDLIPTALLFASFYFLRNNRFLQSFALYGLALSTKLHVIVAFPLIAIFLYRQKKWKQVWNFAIISVALYVLMVAPYFNSPGFQHLVMSNPKQSRVFEVYAQIGGNLKLYLPILATFVTIGRFALYSKINTDLLDAFLVIVFSAIVLLIVPAPGWYVWMTPFLSVFLIKHYRRNKQLLAPFVWLNFFYLLYFVVFDTPDHTDLYFRDEPLQMKVMADTLKGFVFTLLEVGLLSNIVFCYRAGVKSNSIYKRDRAVVIGIGGGSGAGKSTLLADIKKMLGSKVVEIEGDGDHKWERGDANWQHFTHLDPKANFLHRQADTILSLKRGKAVQRSEYDHGTGQFTTPKEIEANDFIILSGLHTFYLPKMRKLIDLKIFMDTDAPLHAKWKVMRDQKERGYSEAQVIEQIEKRRPDADKFISPQRGFADMVVHYFLGKDDTVNGAISDRTDEAAPKEIGNGNNGDVLPVSESTASQGEQLCLQIILSSSIGLENLVDSLRSANVPVFWDYSEDLSRQEITIFKPVEGELLSRLANEVIANTADLIGFDFEWQEGYRGFVQLIVLVALSELMQEREDANVS